MRDRKLIEEEFNDDQTDYTESNAQNQKLMLEVLLDIRDELKGGIKCL